MRDQTHLSSQKDNHPPSAFGPLLDQLTAREQTPGDDATGLLDWIAIWDQAPWRRM